MGIPWEQVSSTTDLLVARSKQLEQSEDIRNKAYQKMMESRAKSVQYWEEKHRNQIRDPLNPGDLVLAYNCSLETQWGKLFSNRWNGPY